jgi:TPR repeat protein
VSWSILWLLFACETDPGPACGEGDAATCLAQAQALLHGEEARRAEALAMLDDACGRLGDVSACRVAGESWLSGMGAVTLDPAAASGTNSPFGKGLRYLERACELGEGEICWQLGSRALKGVGVPRDEGRAAERFEAACASGFMEGCVDRGIFYEGGRGGPKDEAQAAVLYRRACEAGHGRGCTKLGLALRSGTGVTQDAAEAVRLLEKGCEHGFAAGCGLAAIAWERGEGVPVDVARRIEMLIAGALLEDRQAVKHLIGLYREGQVEASRVAELKPSLTSLCREGRGSACLTVELLDEAIGAADDPGAAGLYREACGRGADEACGLLHRMIGEAKALPEAGDTRLLLPERGCSAGFADVCLDLAVGYEQGTFETVDLDAAEKSFERACSLGAAEGCEGLARVKGRMRPSP